MAPTQRNVMTLLNLDSGLLYSFDACEDSIDDR